MHAYLGGHDRTAAIARIASGAALGALIAGCPASEEPTTFSGATGSGGAATTTTTTSASAGGGGSGDIGIDGGCVPPECEPTCESLLDGVPSNAGCTFVVATPAPYGIKSQGTTPQEPMCFALFVVNQHPAPAKLSVSYNGATFDPTQFARIPNGSPDVASWAPLAPTGLPEGEVAVLFLSHDPKANTVCPVPPAVSLPEGTSRRGTERWAGWRLTSTVPVAAYDILPFGGAPTFLPSAEMLYPVTSWGKAHVAVLPPPTVRPDMAPYTQPWAQILAAEDDTHVTLHATAEFGAGPNVPGVIKGGTATFTLKKDEYVQWRLAGDPSGSVVVSDKPVAFTGGNSNVCYQSATSLSGGCDSAHQVIAPLHALGQAYVAAPYKTRITGGDPESVPYRVVGAAAGTTLVYDPPVPGAPDTLTAGQVVDFESTVPFHVKSQDASHPFFLAQVMPGCYVNEGVIDSCPGDEEFVAVLPPAQFQSGYVFFTDPTYATTELVFVRAKKDGAFHDVELDCVGKIDGFVDIGVGGDYQMAVVDIVKDKVPLGACKNGRQHAKSDGPFGVVTWGLDEYASYAYPAGGAVGAINDIPPPQ